MYSISANQVNMKLVVPYSVGGVSFVPKSSVAVKKHSRRTNCNVTRRFADLCSSPCKCLFSLSASVKLFSRYERQYPCHRVPRIQKLCATETDTAVEEADSPTSDEKSGEASSSKVGKDESSNPSSTPAQTTRARGRRSEMPPVKNEELVPGAEFVGKVRSIQPFGAFIDFGAFTDGLVHVSMLSDSFVKDVGSVVSVGQEVKVRLVEANMETGRISLSMKENDGSSKMQQENDGSSRGQKSRPSRRSSSRPGQNRDQGSEASGFFQGQILEGTVKNLTKSGSFISLADGQEGFLPMSEEADDGVQSVVGESSLQVGQEVSVRVLRMTRGKVTLTMKKEYDVQSSDPETTHGVIHAATNPFLAAFRKNKEIATFLEEREKLEKEAEKSVKPGTSEAVEDKGSSVGEITISEPAMKDTPTLDEEMVNVSSVVDENVEGDNSVATDTAVEASVGNEDKYSESTVAEPLKNFDGAVQTMEEEAESSGITVPEGSEALASQITEEAQSVDGGNGNEVSDPSGPENELSEGNESITSLELQPDLTTTQKDEVESNTSDTAVEMANEKVLVNQFENAEKEVQIQDPTAKSIISSTSQPEEENMGSIPEENSSVTVSANSSPENSATKATISPALVKQLREETGAGMMDCKKALSETGGDIVKALEFLRKKGLASAEKKASRATAEGRIGSYIHDSRIGVLIEVNCETDFVSRGDIFKELVDDLAMQVAACPQVKYLTTEDVPEDFVSKEKEIEMQKEDLLSKPEQIREKIVEGRIRKRLEDLALLEQPYIKNDKVVVKDWVKQTIATIGENMKVKRFVRYNLGEGLEKKSQDFAAEVAAQTAAKPATTPGKEQPTAVETKDTDQKSPTVAVSAALVKQLREETGAGMMDCKKALSETGGDLEKAQEYLRKKGLSTADKKSSRLAAEGRIGTYIHDSRIGVLIEVNCETDFVGRSEKFKELVDDLAMQVVACPQVQFVSIEEIPETIVNKEKELEMQREDILSKPENIREKIVQGRISKRLGELALLEQPYIKNDSLLVKDLVKQTVAALGENIKVRRFLRFTLGETDNTTIN